MSSVETELQETPSIAGRFRGFLPIVIDVETGGFHSHEHALLEVAAILIHMNEQGFLSPSKTMHFMIQPYPGLKIDSAALAFNGIELTKHQNEGLHEKEALTQLNQWIRNALKKEQCTRAILVGHNAFFDLGFLRTAIERNNIKRNPMHPFSCFDTATLGGLAYGQTVLARACEAAMIDYDSKKAHSALYDAQVTANLFCNIVNKWKDLGGWPLDTEGFRMTDCDEF